MESKAKYIPIEIGQVIEYNFLFSNEEKKIGLVIDYKKDNNFHAMIYLLSNNTLDIIPFNIMEYKTL